MSNSYTFPVAYSAMLDRIYQESAKTAILTAGESKYKFSSTDAKTVYLKTMTVSGLANYTRDTGYNTGDIAIDYQANTMAMDRGKKFILDVLDAKEAYTQIAEVAAEFMRTKVIPELDAYRFHKIVSLTGIDAQGTLDYDTVISAINVGQKTLDDAEVPQEGRVLFVSNETMQNMKKSGEFFKVLNIDPNVNGINTNIANYDGMPIIPVPTSRFYTACIFNNTTAGGYIRKNTETDGEEINFMIAYTPDICGIVKHTAPKIIVPEVNQTSDGWIYCFRMYHDLFIPYNKLSCVYTHSKNTYV